MEEEVREAIRKKTTEELLEAISENPDDYTEDAIIYMQDVLAKRGVPYAEIERRKAAHRQKIMDIEQRGKNRKEHKRWVEVKNFPSRLFAEQAKELLENNGIVSMIKGDDIGIIGSGVYGTSWPHGISLYVLEEDFEKSKSLIESFYGDA